MARPTSPRHSRLRFFGTMFIILGALTLGFVVLYFARGKTFACVDGCPNSMDEVYSWPYPLPMQSVLVGSILAIVLGFIMRALAPVAMLFGQIKTASGLDLGGFRFPLGSTFTELPAQILKLTGKTLPEMMSGFSMGAPNAVLIENGQQGQATITSSQDTGVKVGDGSLYVLQLEVNAGGQMHEVQHPALVPSAQLARVTEGSTLPVKVDPTNPNLIAIQW